VEAETLVAGRGCANKACGARGLFLHGVSAGFRQFPAGFRQNAGISAVLIQPLEIIGKKSL
jgi:hypothetical protein